MALRSRFLKASCPLLFDQAAATADEEVHVALDYRLSGLFQNVSFAVCYLRVRTFNMILVRPSAMMRMMCRVCATSFSNKYKPLHC
jgi:hypothetical protein